MSLAYQPLLAAVSQGGAVNIGADTGNVQAAGQVAAIVVSRRIAANAAAVTVMGQVADYARGRAFEAETGSFDVAGGVPDVVRALRLQAAACGILVAGQSASPKFAWRIVADAAELTATVPEIAFQRYRSFVLAATVGGFAIEGQSCSTRAARRLTALAGGFVIDGKPAVITQQTPGGGTPPQVPASAAVRISIGL